MCNVYPVVWGALAESVGPAKAARQIDMSIKTLANWLIAAREGKPLSPPSRPPVSELESELARLRAEVDTPQLSAADDRRCSDQLRWGSLGGGRRGLWRA